MVINLKVKRVMLTFSLDMYALENTKKGFKFY